MAPSFQQLVFDLPHRPAFGAEDFFVSVSNQRAVELLDLWPAWPSWAVIVVGPAGSGKSHLTHVWRMQADAACLDAAGLSEESVALLERHKTLVVENIDRGINNEKVLFHILNTAQQQRLSVLMTSRAAPGDIAAGLPDLRSRLRALPVVTIAPPDAALLTAVLVKLFADRQLRVAPPVITYLALRIERSVAAAARVVDIIDRHSLSARRKITRPLVAEALASTGDFDPSDRSETGEDAEDEG